jgi:hypothetical protein
MMVIQVFYNNKISEKLLMYAIICKKYYFIKNYTFKIIFLLLKNTFGLKKFSHEVNPHAFFTKIYRYMIGCRQLNDKILQFKLLSVHHAGHAMSKPLKKFKLIHISQVGRKFN